MVYWTLFSRNVLSFCHFGWRRPGRRHPPGSTHSITHINSDKGMERDEVVSRRKIRRQGAVEHVTRNVWELGEGHGPKAEQRSRTTPAQGGDLTGGCRPLTPGPRPKPSGSSLISKMHGHVSTQRLLARPERVNGSRARDLKHRMLPSSENSPCDLDPCSPDLRVPLWKAKFRQKRPLASHRNWISRVKCFSGTR